MAPEDGCSKEVQVGVHECGVFSDGISIVVGRAIGNWFRCIDHHGLYP